MNFFAKLKKGLPSPKNVLLILLSAVLLTLAFPDFEFWFLAWFALVPMFFAIEREKHSKAKSFILGWIWGATFFFGTCWWLGYAPTHYGGIPAIISYFLAFCAAFIVGIFPAIFAMLFSILLKKFGTWAILNAPFLWTAVEFLRFWTTGNNWNAIAYSQAFSNNVKFASVGGIWLVGFYVVLINSVYFAVLLFIFKSLFSEKKSFEDLMFYKPTSKQRGYAVIIALSGFFFPIFLELLLPYNSTFLSNPFYKSSDVYVIAVQPNVPMNGLSFDEREKLLDRHTQLAERAFKENVQKFVEAQTSVHSKPETLEQDKKFYKELEENRFEKNKKIVIFPESPMNFMFDRDKDFQVFLKDFATHNNVSVLFNSAEPNAKEKNYFNSAVMINERGEKVAQYDKIFLVPFGEYAPVPAPLQAFVPTMVGSFAAGNEYDLLGFGEAKAGVMICFESHFPNLSREYALRGADVLVEMTNDGYLGKTPVLRQHLASAVFRAVETNRPVLRVTNVGITAYINERGEVLDAADSYTEAARVWTVSKSDGAQTFYVKYGDWFAWLCSIVSLVFLILSFRSKKAETSA